VRWPVYALVPLGMMLLLLQCLSQLVKHVAFLRGSGPPPALPSPAGSDPEDEGPAGDG
jgi:TRAP-type mannitol/chloroaromatic compound transport system permease small subunit